MCYTSGVMIVLCGVTLLYIGQCTLGIAGNVDQHPLFISILCILAFLALAWFISLISFLLFLTFFISRNPRLFSALIRIVRCDDVVYLSRFHSEKALVHHFCQFYANNFVHVNVLYFRTYFSNKVCTQVCICKDLCMTLLLSTYLHHGSLKTSFFIFLLLLVLFIF